MAKVTYKEGVKPFSGIYCGVLYKTYATGTKTAELQQLPSEEETQKNPAARADRIVKLCVMDIQHNIGNPYEAIRRYAAINKRVGRLYGKLYELEEDNSKLQQMILDAYYGRRRALPSRNIRAPTLEFG